MPEKVAGKLQNVVSLPYPKPGELPRAAWFASLSDAISGQGGVRADAIDPAMIRLVRTNAGTGSYPTLASEPNVYGFKFLKILDYTETPGQQTVTKTARNSNSDYDGVLLNLAALQTWDDAFYIPVNTVLWAFQVANRWFTWYGSSGSAGELIHFKTAATPVPAFNAGTGQMGSLSVTQYTSSGGGLLSSGSSVTVYNEGAEFPAGTFGHAVTNSAGIPVITSSITNIRVDGTDFQYSIDGTTWVTWHAGTACP